MNIRNLLKNTLLTAMGMTTFVSCINSDYDLSKDINLELTLGGNMLAFPIGNMDTVYMMDLIDTTETVKIVDGKYVMVMANEVEPSKVTIGKISLQPDQVDIKDIEFDFNTPAYAPSLNNEMNYQIISTIVPKGGEFVIDNNVTKELDILRTVVFADDQMPECVIKVKINPVAGVESVSFLNVICKLPDFITFESDVTDGILNISGDIDIARGEYDFEKVLKIKSLDFTKRPGGGINTEIVNGKTRFYASESILVNGGTTLFEINNNQLMSPNQFKEMTFDVDIKVDEMYVTEVYGKFDPEIDQVKESINIDLGDDGEFLKNDATFDFTNPQIYLKLGNDIGADIKVNMSIWGEDDYGSEISGSRIYIEDILVGATDVCGVTKESKWVISKTSDVKDSYQIKRVPELDELFRKIPTNVRFLINAKAEGDNHKVDLSKTMSFTGEYEVLVPMEFEVLQLL